MANFSIYNKSGARTSNFPEASQEQLISISFYDEEGLSVGGFSLANHNAFGTVIGYMTKEFEYNATGNYTNIFNVQSHSSDLWANLMRDESQRNIMNYGVFTKKMYLNGESPTLEIDFRCYAGDDTGFHHSYYTLPDNTKADISNPVLVANALINATLPRVSAKNIFNEKNSSQVVKNLANGTFSTAWTTIKADTESAFAGSVNSLNAVLGADGSPVLAQVAQTATDAAVGNSQKLQTAIDTATLDQFVSRKPPVCYVKIGNIFEKDCMFVKSVSVKLSKEYLSKGVPLYGDFSVTLQSLFNAATLNQNGSNSSSQEMTFGSGLNGVGSSKYVLNFATR